MSDYIYILAPLSATVAAQLLKVLLEAPKDRMQFALAFASGGMPSSHTAGIVSLTTLLAVKEGITSPLFGLALTVMVVILYDSVGVRRTTGENALAINEIKHELKLSTHQKVHLAKGHTPIEVLGGLILGVAIGYTWAILL